jgi:lipopolysaccharide export system protein LptA
MAEPQSASIRRYQLFRKIRRIVTLVLLVSFIGILVLAFLKRYANRPAPVRLAGAAIPPSKNIIAITQDYDFTQMENGKPKYRLKAFRETTYDNGLHELEKLELVSFDLQGKEASRITADSGTYESEAALVKFKGHVIAKNNEGLEVRSEALAYDQKADQASTDQAVTFSQAALSGSSVGALLDRKQQVLSLHKDAYIKIAEQGKTPIELRGAKAGIAPQQGSVVFDSNASVTQGTETGRADRIIGIFTPAAKEQPPKLQRIEAQGNAYLNSQEKGKASEVKANVMVFTFDELQRLRQVATGGGTLARSLEPDAPRQLSTDNLKVNYLVQTPNAPNSTVSTIESSSRTTLRLSPEKGAIGEENAERVLESDAVKTTFHPGGKFLAQVEATGNAVLTITPQTVTPQAERKKLQAAKFTAEFSETGNLIQTFTADNNAIAEFEPLQPASKRQKRKITGKQMVAHFAQPAQDITDLTVDGDARITEPGRQATAAKAVYMASTSTVQMRGKPKVWDSSLRVDASEIDVNIETSESFARGRVLTTYYSREATGGAAPFTRTKAPIFIASDRAAVKHLEGAARYEGNARAWQEDNFVRGQVIELDRNNRTMNASGGVNSALYNVEREVEEKTPPAIPATGANAQVQPAQMTQVTAKKRKEVVPVFASSEQMSYSDQQRVVRYSGNVKIQQGTDRIEGGTTDVKIDETNRMESLLASSKVVLTQPGRRGTGERLEYSVVNDVAVLTGDPARIEDREREGSTTGQKLTLNLRDARIQAADEGGSKRVRTTHRIRQ